MKKHIYTINNKGFIDRVLVGEFNELGKLISPVGEFITKSLPQPLPFQKPRWNGNGWVEGESEHERIERETNEQLASLLPSREEIADAELEIKILTLLTELEVF